MILGIGVETAQIGQQKIMRPGTINQHLVSCAMNAEEKKKEEIVKSNK